MRAAMAFWIAFAGIASACVSPNDPLGRSEALEEKQKRYTEAIRWGDIERAAQYVEPEQRSAFLALAPAFESVRFSDYEIGELDFESDERLAAEIEVTFRGYALPHYVERKIRDRQVWERAEGMRNDWFVKPELATLIDQLGAHPLR